MRRAYRQRGERRAFTEIRYVGPSERSGWLAPAVLIVASLALGVLVALFGPGALR
jgi:hypothetical protein